MNFKSQITEFTKIIKCFFLWLLLGITVGALCGAIGALFAKSISFVTLFRFQNGWVLFLLPFLGLLSVLIYKISGVTDIGTNQVFEAVNGEKKLPVLLAPAIFSASVITHLCGGSAGKEGAALQLGGSISGAVAKIFKLDEGKRHILTLCGMSALFSAVFGTPLGACVFALEVVRVGYIYSAALFPTFISSVTAFLISSALGVKPEGFELKILPQFELSVILKVALISVAGAVVSIIFCKALHLSEKLFKKYLKNPYLRIFTGGAIIILLTVILKTTDYNGGGMNIIEKIFSSGEVKPEAFLLKIIFTAITVGAGFKGGEIVPTMFIGATLGGSIALLLGLNPALGAAVGLAALFCGVTNCPLATCILSVELFGANAILYIAIGCFTSFLLSGNCSLYSSQKFVFSKLEEKTT